MTANMTSEGKDKDRKDSGLKESTEEGVVKRSRAKDLVLLIIIALFIFAAVRGVGGLKDSDDNENAAGGSAGYSVLSDNAFMLDTFCTVNIYASKEDEEVCKKALEVCMDRLSELDNLLNPSKEDSDIWRINHREGDAVTINETTARLLECIREPEMEAGGDFNIAVEPLSSLWNFDERKTVPEESEIEEALSHVYFGGWNVEKEGDESIFVTEHDDLRIDVGAFAKGFIADELKKVLSDNGVSSAVINLGGNVLCVGKRPDGTNFRIGLKEPEKSSSKYLAELSVDDSSVVTAGIYERYFEENGVHYHHILDTKTGYPVQNELSAVSIVGKESVMCDFLSTTLFIKGEEEGTSFLNEFNKKRGLSGDDAYKAYFIKKDGSLVAANEASAALIID